MDQDNNSVGWRAVDVNKPAATIGPTLRAIAGAPGKEAAEIRAALSGGSDAAGGFTLPSQMHDEFVAMASRGMSAVQAGARVIQLAHDDLTIPRVLTAPTPAWRLENGAVAESEPTFEAATLTPRSLSMLVKISRELLADGFEIERVLTETIGSAVAQELDRACYRGTGTAPQPLGLLNRVLLRVPNESGAAYLTDWGPLNNMYWMLAGSTSPHPVVPNAMVIPAELAGTLENMNTARDSQLREQPKTLSMLPRHISKGLGPALGDTPGYMAAVIGDFRQMLIGWRGAVRIELLRERYADNGQVAFLVHARVGFELLNPWAFIYSRNLMMSNNIIL